ncbi:hypothetical protein QBC37DRAFT_380045 [Rhypophila decipiens]|uniref:Uncharacterized protein n=1 Tax=Rhypophila decipiens TaxID=261697 RepID=A0AAN6XVP0_9PEZI|nr:hypothetical protein QBC37DRAFT_380045 [Rhypophila decipiens]
MEVHFRDARVSSGLSRLWLTMTVQQQSRFSVEDQGSVNKLLQDYFDSAREDEGND